MPGGAIAVASDHAGFDLKEILKRDLQEAGHEVLDLGTNSTASVDYPDFGKAMGLSAGFNRTGFAADRDLAGYEYTQRGAYLRLRFKFDETLFKGDSRDVNRSLDR